MGLVNKIRDLDAFPKIFNDFKVKTKTGGCGIIKKNII